MQQDLKVRFQDQFETTCKRSTFRLRGMTLNPHPTYPSVGHYVLRLHQQAHPQAGRLTGRIQHVTSGEFVDFACNEDLLAWLVHHATQWRARSNDASQDSA